MVLSDDDDVLPLSQMTEQMQVTPMKSTIQLDSESEDDFLPIFQGGNIPEFSLMKKGKNNLKRRKEITPKKTGSSTLKKSPANKKQRLERVKGNISVLVFTEEEGKGGDSEFSSFSDDRE